MTKLEELRAAYVEALARAEDDYNHAYAKYYLAVANEASDAADAYRKELEKQNDKGS